MNDIGRIDPVRLRGTEHFSLRGSSLQLTVLDFWAWSASDLMQNTTRGILAEFIVAHAIGADTTGVRDGWAAADLVLADGTLVEVKSSSYIQSWEQKALSRITYGIAPTRVWDPDAGAYTGEVKRQADIYVFGLLAPRLGNEFDPKDFDQWVFYVLSTAELDRHVGARRSISLSNLRTIAETVTYSELADAVEKAKPTAI